MLNLIKRHLNSYDFNAVMKLYLDTYKNDSYYKHLFPNRESREKEILNSCGEKIKYILKNCSIDTIGLFNPAHHDVKGNWCDDELVAFVISFVYRSSETSSEKTPELEIQKRMLGKLNIIHYELKDIYPLSYINFVCEKWGYRSQDLVFQLIEEKIKEYPHWSLAMDTSNQRYIDWLKKHNFEIIPFGPNELGQVLAIYHGVEK